MTHARRISFDDALLNPLRVIIEWQQNLQEVVLFAFGLKNTVKKKWTKQKIQIILVLVKILRYDLSNIMLWSNLSWDALK